LPNRMKAEKAKKQKDKNTVHFNDFLEMTRVSRNFQAKILLFFHIKKIQEKIPGFFLFPTSFD